MNNKESKIQAKNKEIDSLKFEFNNKLDHTINEHKKQYELNLKQVNYFFNLFLNLFPKKIPFLLKGPM